MAITERYVNATGAASGDGTGSSFANAMTFANFIDYMSAGGSFTAAAGDRFNIINNGTASRTTEATAWVNGGSTTSPVVVRGVDSSGNSFAASRTNGNGPLVTTNMPVLSYTSGRVNLTGTNIILENLNIKTANSGLSVTMSSGTSGLVLHGCAVENSSTSSSALCTTLAGNSVINCDLSLTGATNGNICVESSATGSRIIGCRVKGGATQGIAVTAGGATIIGCLVYGSPGVGIGITSTTAIATIYGCTIVGNTGDGIDIVTGTTSWHAIIGCLITDNGGYGIDGVSAANAMIAAWNRLDRNTSGAINLATDWAAVANWGNNTTSLANSSTPGDNEYVSPGSANYNYQLKRGSYAVGNGLPGYASMGAYQRQENYPVTTDVKNAVAYGPNSEQTGSYSASGGGGPLVGGRLVL